MGAITIICPPRLIQASLFSLPPMTRPTPIPDLCNIFLAFAHFPVLLPWLDHLGSTAATMHPPLLPVEFSPEPPAGSSSVRSWSLQPRPSSPRSRISNDSIIFSEALPEQDSSSATRASLHTTILDRTSIQTDSEPAPCVSAVVLAFGRWHSSSECCCPASTPPAAVSTTTAVAAARSSTSTPVASTPEPPDPTAVSSSCSFFLSPPERLVSEQQRRQEFSDENNDTEDVTVMVTPVASVCNLPPLPELETIPPTADKLRKAAGAVVLRPRGRQS